MKRQKRDMLARAFEKGYQMGFKGRSRDMRPKQDGAAHQEWMNGWREGREDKWSGFTGVSGLQKLNKLVIHHQH